LLLINERLQDNKEPARLKQKKDNLLAWNPMKILLND